MFNYDEQIRYPLLVFKCLNMLSIIVVIRVSILRQDLQHLAVKTLTQLATLPVPQRRVLFQTDLALPT